MKKVIGIAVLVIAATPALIAGEPPELDIFGTAQRCFELTEEQRGVINQIRRQREIELDERMKEIRKELDKKYVKVVGEALPPAESKKYEKVVDAQLARDEIIADADAEYAGTVKDALAKHKAEAAPGRRLPRWWPAVWSKDDIVDTYLKLSDEQRETIDELKKIREKEWQSESRKIERPEDWGNAEAREKFGNEMRDLRKTIEAETLEAMWMVLTEQQKKACTAAFEALQTWEQKVDEAVEECDKKITEQVGEDMLERLTHRGRRRR